MIKLKFDKRRKTNISKERLRLLYWKKGLTIKEISRIYGCSLNTISLRLRKYKIKLKTSKKPYIKKISKYKKLIISKKKLKELYQEKGFSAKDIAKFYRCHNRTILARLYDCKIKVRNKRDRFPVSKKKLYNLYVKKGYSSKKVSRLLGCSKATVLNKLHKFGLPVRTKWNKLSISKMKLKKLYVNQRLSSRKIAGICGCWYSTIDRKIKEYGFETRTRAEAHRIYPRKDFNDNLIEKAYLIGFKIGDLRARKVWKNGETIHVDCGSSKHEQIKLIKDLFKKYGRVWIKRNKNRKGYFQIEAYLNNSFSFLLEQKAPKWVFKDKKYFFPFLAGFIDAEGCIKINKHNQAYFSLGNYDSPLLFLIKDKLKKYGMDSNGPYEIDTSKYFNNEGYGYNKNYWHLGINRKSTLLEFLESIEPYIRHEQKIKDLKIAKMNIIDRNLKNGKRIFYKHGY